jgi:hypothetical protein
MTSFGQFCNCLEILCAPLSTVQLKRAEFRMNGLTLREQQSDVLR